MRRRPARRATSGTRRPCRSSCSCWRSGCRSRSRCAPARRAPRAPASGRRRWRTMFETRTRWSQLTLQVIVTIAVIPFLVPLVTMVSRSLEGRGWGNYLAVVEVPGFLTFFRNSAIVAGGSITIVYLATMAGAFGFSKLRIRRKELFFWMMMAALTLPEVVLIAPLYATAVRLGMMGTFWSVILPIAALQVPFTILLIRDDMGVVTLLPEFFRRQYNDDTPKILAAAEELRQQRDDAHVVADEEHLGQQVRVPRVDQHEDEDGRRHRPCQRHEDRPEEPPGVRPVEAGGLE